MYIQVSKNFNCPDVINIYIISVSKKLNTFSIKVINTNAYKLNFSDSDHSLNCL